MNYDYDYNANVWGDVDDVDRMDRLNEEERIREEERKEEMERERKQQVLDRGSLNNRRQAEPHEVNPDSQPPPPDPSWLSKFLRQHVPLCGLCMDFMSSILHIPFIARIVQNIDRDLLISKTFYFFFYSAFGSLFPLMGVYFKQLGMNPAQVGILTGVRPFIEIFSAPFWHSLAARFHKSKALLLFSLFNWILFTYSLAHIRPPASACVAFNDSVYLLYTPYSANDLSNYDVGDLEQAQENKNETENNEIFLDRPPPSGMINEKEGKDAILAKEESQNEQRKRRRRRKRQVYTIDDDEDDNESNEQVRNLAKINNQRYTYTIDSGIESGASSSDGSQRGDETQFIELDLESDFDDEPLEGKEQKSGSGFNIGQYLGLARQKRETREDQIFGDSDEPEQEEEKPKQNGQQKKKTKQQKNEEANEAEESQDDEEDEDGEETNNEKYHKKRPSITPPTTTTTTTITTTQPTTTTPSSSEGREETQNQPKKFRKVYRQRHKTPPTHIVGMSPITVEYAANYNKEKHSQFVTPMFSTIVYKLDDIKEVFFLLLLLICLGEFFSAPALTLADSATLSYLGDNTDLYGRQRLFGSLSWAITLLLVGMALDNSTSIADHPCGPHPRERSYTVCFAIFSLLMACAFLTATQFRFSYPKSSSSHNNQQSLMVSSMSDSRSVVTKTIDEDDLYASTQPRSIFNTAPPINSPPPNATGSRARQPDKFEYLEKWKSAVFAQNTRELPEWVNVFRQFKNSLHLTYLFITWFLGCGVGLVFTFLFWHLQDVGGTPTLFGICSVINHISEIFAYFFSFSFIKRFGHTKVLSFGLGCNVIRFLYVAFLTNPYYALPFELVQGITHAACFAACCSYISHVSKPELRTSTQGVMQGLHHGIGRACGTIIGGYMINAIGSRASFCFYGLLSGCVLAGFLYVRKKASEMKDEEVKVDDSEALGGYGAPQGVPSAIPVANQNTTNDTDLGYDYQW